MGGKNHAYFMDKASQSEGKGKNGGKGGKPYGQRKDIIVNSFEAFSNRAKGRTTNRINSDTPTTTRANSDTSKKSSSNGRANITIADILKVNPPQTSQFQPEDNASPYVHGEILGAACNYRNDGPNSNIRKLALDFHNLVFDSLAAMTAETAIMNAGFVEMLGVSGIWHIAAKISDPAYRDYDKNATITDEQARAMRIGLDAAYNNNQGKVNSETPAKKPEFLLKSFAEMTNEDKIKLAQAYFKVPQAIIRRVLGKAENETGWAARTVIDGTAELNEMKAINMRMAITAGMQEAEKHSERVQKPLKAGEPMAEGPSTVTKEIGH